MSFAFVIGDTFGQVAHFRYFDAIGGRFGQEDADAAVGGLKVVEGYAGHVGGRHLFQSVAVHESEAPVALADVVAEGKANAVALFHEQFEVFKQARFGFIDLVLGGRVGFEGFDGFEQDALRFFDGLFLA